MGGRLKHVADTQTQVTQRQASRLGGAGVQKRKEGRNSSSSTLRGGSQAASANPMPPSFSLWSPLADAPAPAANRPPVPEGVQHPLASEDDRLDSLSGSGATTLAGHGLAQAGDPVIGIRQEVVEDYWYALSHIGGIFRLDSAQFVFQDWDIKVESLKVSTIGTF